MWTKLVFTTNRQEALRAIKITKILLSSYGIVFCVRAATMQPMKANSYLLLVSGLICLIFYSLLSIRLSKITVILLVVFGSIELILTLINVVLIPDAFLDVILLYYAIRTLDAVFKLQGKFKEGTSTSQGLERT
jgi:hypothetical protein